EDIQSKQMTAAAAAQWLRNHLVTLMKGDIARINSIITDTCKLMFKMWLKIQKLDEFKHVFFIPCDLHGLQLLVGDLLKIPVFKEVLNKAPTVVTRQIVPSFPIAVRSPPGLSAPILQTTS